MQRPANSLLPRLAAPEPLLYKAPSKVGVWLSLVEHRVRDAGVAGSNPATPTILPKVDVFQRLGGPAASASGAPFCNDFRSGSTADLAGQGHLPRRHGSTFAGRWSNAGQ